MTVLSSKAARTAVFGVLLIGALLAASSHVVEFERFAQLLRDAQPQWLLAALALQIATYLLVAAVWRQALRAAAAHVRFATLIPLSVAKLFADEALPSAGVSGTAFFVAALGRRGIPPAACMATLLLSLVSYYAAYALMGLTAYGALRAHGAAPWWVTTTVIAFVAMAMLIPATVLLLKAGAHLPMPGWLLRRAAIAGFLRMLAQAPADLVRRPGIVLPALLLHAAIFLLDGATLWAALLAVGHETSFWVAFPAFMMGAMVAAMSGIPMGLGSFEAACVVTLSLLGVSLPSAFAATLLLRGFTLWLPMLPGVWLARREIVRN